MNALTLISIIGVAIGAFQLGWAQGHKVARLNYTEEGKTTTKTVNMKKPFQKRLEDAMEEQKRVKNKITNRK